MGDFYEVLGVSPSADEAVIRAAYRAMMLKHHPDKNNDERSGWRAREINEAFSVLSDPEKRRAYDEERCDRKVDPPKQDNVPPTSRPSTSSRPTGSPATRYSPLVPMMIVAVFLCLSAGIIAMAVSASSAKEASSALVDGGVTEGTFGYSSRLDEFTDITHSSAEAWLPSESNDDVDIFVRFDCIVDKNVANGDDLKVTVSQYAAKNISTIDSVGYRVGRNSPVIVPVRALFGMHQTSHAMDLYTLNRYYGEITRGGSMMVRIETSADENDVTINLAEPSVQRVISDCIKHLNRREVSETAGSTPPSVPEVDEEPPLPAKLSSKDAVEPVETAPPDAPSGESNLPPV